MKKYTARRKKTESEREQKTGKLFVFERKIARKKKKKEREEE